MPDDFFYFVLWQPGQHGTSLYVEFHDRRRTGLGSEVSRRNHRSGHIKTSLATLNDAKFSLLIMYLF